MKKIISKIMLLVLMVSLVIPIAGTSEVKAASGTIVISTDKVEVEKGGTVNVTVTVTTDTPLDALMFSLNYDNKVFSCSGYSGVINEDVEAEKGASFSSKTFRYSFKAEGVGNTSITIASNTALAVVDASKMDYAEISLSPTGATVNVVDHIASGNADLSGINLSTGYLWPNFSANTTTYAVGLDNSITSLTITCPTADKNAKVSFDTNLLKDLKVGQTDVPITVTAENGTTKKYVLQVVRYAKEEEKTTAKQEEQTTTAKPVENKLTTTIDGNEYTILRDISTIKLPDGYSLNVEKYGDTDIAVAKNASTKLTLAYLLDKDANGDFYIYDASKKTFAKYVAVAGNAGELIVVTPTSTIDGTKNDKVEIGNQKITAWFNKEIPDIYFFYAMNSKGEKNWYSYDLREGTIQRAYALDGIKMETAPIVTEDLSDELEAAEGEIDRLTRELAAAKSSKKLTSRLIIIVILSLLIVALIIVIIYLILRLRAERDEAAVSEETMKMLEQELNETKDLVAYTDEKFQLELQAEKERQSSVEQIEDELKKSEEQSVNEELLKSEIGKALDKLGSLDDDTDISFLYEDDDFK